MKKDIFLYAGFFCMIAALDCAERRSDLPKNSPSKESKIFLKLSSGELVERSERPRTVDSLEPVKQSPRVDLQKKKKHEIQRRTSDDSTKKDQK
jgi:hypothetical protein